MRQLISSGSPYEPKVGISRAVRVGSIIAVSGTAPLLDGKTVGKGDAAAQARRCLDIIKDALERAGSSLDQVVRTRTLLTRIDDWQAEEPHSKRKTQTVTARAKDGDCAHCT
jgi:enamine deaminase RidA (YjgF/YER057c/UK114 family)